MPEWLILLAVIFVALRIRRRHRWRHSLRDERLRAMHAGREAPATPQALPPRETPLETLQRRFVAGSISVEQYEAELDRMLRRPGGTAGHLDA